MTITAAADTIITTITNIVVVAAIMIIMITELIEMLCTQDEILSVNTLIFAPFPEPHTYVPHFAGLLSHVFFYSVLKQRIE